MADAVSPDLVPGFYEATLLVSAPVRGEYTMPVVVIPPATEDSVLALMARVFCGGQAVTVEAFTLTPTTAP
ncbi:MAG: hypothetical protein HOY69_22235 [Streptomyces sp.]|nr:hypothetical protein [Streptomyces sp.]